MPRNPNRNIEGELDEVLTKLCLKLAKETHKLAGDGNSHEYRETIKVITAYKAMKNRQPGDAEGGDFADYRAQLAGNHPDRGGDTGDGGGDPDEGAGPIDATAGDDAGTAAEPDGDAVHTTAIPDSYAA